MKTNLALGAALALCLLWLGMHVGWARERVQSQFHQAFPLATNGHVRLDNVNGHVHITTWDQPKIEVDAVKSGKKLADLDAVKIDIDSQPDQIRIHTHYPRFRWSFWGRNNPTIVDYEIKVPGPARIEDLQNINGSIEIEGVTGNVHANTVNGRLIAEGLAADTSLTSVNGRVVATFVSVDQVNHASVQTVNGRVRITLPAAANAEVSAHTVNGRIHTGPELTPIKHWPVGTDLRGKLGHGGAQLRAETVNGSIDIHTFEVTAKNTSPQPRTQPVKPEAE
jgi:DUF4097 and DUF4098 domain-containing protein YvlB